MASYRIYGLDLRTDFRFANRLPAGSFEQPDLEILAQADFLKGLADEGDEVLYSSPYRDSQGRPSYRLILRDGVEILRSPEIADYWLEPNKILYQTLAEGIEGLIEIQLLGAVLSYFLERRGVLALHAAAVSLAGRAVGLLAGNAGGKTGLAATLISRGHSLLSDDILPVEERGEEFLAHAGYPQMRMWPDEAEHFLGSSWQDLPVVHPRHDKRRVKVGFGGGLGRFESASMPLQALYVVDRRPAEELDRPRVETLSAGDALRQLLRGTFTPFILEATGLDGARLDRLSRLLGRVAIRRLVYPSGFERLSEAAAVLEADLAG